MYTRLELFQRWLGDGTKDDKLYLITFHEITSYLESVSSLEEIDADFADDRSTLNLMKNRNFGTLLYSILTLQELAQHLPKAAPAKAVFKEVSTLLTGFYSKPNSINGEGVFRALELMGTLLSLYPKQKSDQTQLKNLHLSLYFCLYFTKFKLERMPWYKAKAASLIIDIDKMKAKVNALVIQTRDFDFSEAASPTIYSGLTQVDTALVQRTAIRKAQFLSLLQASGLMQNNLESITSKMQLLLADSGDLLESMNAKTSLESKLPVIKSLLAKLNQGAAGNNFLGFYAANQVGFDLLFNSLTGHAVEHLKAKIKELSSTEVTQNLGWMLSFYNFFIPQTLQSILTVFFPLTLDNQCLQLSKSLTTQLIRRSKSELHHLDKNINRSLVSLFHKYPPLRSFFQDQSSAEVVETLYGEVKHIKETAEKYQALAVQIERWSKNMDEMQSNQRVLDRFIVLNDGFLVALSNFFAKLWSIFKTETATLIDQSRAMKIELNNLIMDHRKAIETELSLIENDSSVLPELKARFAELEPNTGSPLFATDELVEPTHDSVKSMLASGAMLFKLDAKVDDSGEFRSIRPI